VNTLLPQIDQAIRTTILAMTIARQSKYSVSAHCLEEHLQILLQIQLDIFSTTVSSGPINQQVQLSTETIAESKKQIERIQEELRAAAQAALEGYSK
jgi:cob(I)alamin adenosyltransferase